MATVKDWIENIEEMPAEKAQARALAINTLLDWDFFAMEFKNMGLTTLKRELERRCNQIKCYAAVTSKGLKIVSVLASDRGEARDKIEEQLKRVGRSDIYDKWISGGMKIEERTL